VLDSQDSIAAIVVTYNRKSLLRECLTSLLNQTHSLDEIIVVDNASTDGTRQMLDANFPGITILSLPKNIGGTGGFAKGIQLAYEQGHQWFCLMDDDLLPSSDALECLVQVLDNVDNPLKTFIGGLAQDKFGNLIWDLKVNNQWISHTANLADRNVHREGVEVEYLAFLGLLIPAQALVELGLPRIDFFVYLDDVEYCYRAKKNNYAIICAPQSKLFHPLPQRDQLRLFNKVIFVERFPVWKAYYEVRNRILLGMEYEGRKFWMHLLPVVLLRAVLSFIWYKEKRVTRLWLQALGMWDGFRGCTDRHIVP
jgi:rhamnopyranosyl-N-acetylglucosaminyl-diphospho-decaprenol beta-1,3/1,4-galactofuranosyltransferase